MGQIQAARAQPEFQAARPFPLLGPQALTRGRVRAVAGASEALGPTLPLVLCPSEPLHPCPTTASSTKWGSYPQHIRSRSE